jgi:lipid II:glycine glycyltransferase (peptidoglycan interpeptide bridge formation enzyme)
MGVALSLHPEIIDTRGIEWFFYENRKARVQPMIITKYTGVIRIASHRSFKSYQDTIRKVRKQEIKKSLDLRMKIQENTDRIEEFVMLYEKTFLRQGIKLSNTNKEMVSRVIRSGISSLQGKLDLIYLPNGEPVSGMYTLFDDKSEYYLYGATDPKHRGTFGSSLLMLNAIERTFLENKTLFDFCGMNSPHRGEYKSSFNARVQPYFEVDFKPIREVSGG